MKRLPWGVPSSPGSFPTGQLCLATGHTQTYPLTHTSGYREKRQTLVTVHALSNLLLRTTLREDLGDSLGNARSLPDAGRGWGEALGAREGFLPVQLFP